MQSITAGELKAHVDYLADDTLEGRLPGTLNFQDLTATHVRMTVVEDGCTSSGGCNEKEVEYGDFDNDGDLDVAVAVAHSDFGQRRNKLYRNDSTVFVEVSGA